MNRWYIVFVTILILGGAWLWASRVPVEAQIASLAPQPALGHPAPDFTLTTLNGETFTLSALRGTPVVLNFWATWCGPCQRELPALQATYSRYAGAVTIAALDQGEPPATVQHYANQLGLSFAIPMDADQTVATRYNIRGLPTTFFIDSDGVIRSMWTGEMNRITLAEGIAKIWPQ